MAEMKRKEVIIQRRKGKDETERSTETNAFISLINWNSLQIDLILKKLPKILAIVPCVGREAAAVF